LDGISARHGRKGRIQCTDLLYLDGGSNEGELREAITRAFGFGSGRHRTPCIGVWEQRKQHGPNDLDNHGHHVGDHRRERQQHDRSLG
jgi:hypothetical protein